MAKMGEYRGEEFPFLYIGSARTHNPTSKNFALEPPQFGAVAKVSPSRCAMDRPRLEGTTLLIMVSPVPGKYEVQYNSLRLFTILIPTPTQHVSPKRPCVSAAVLNTHASKISPTMASLCLCDCATSPHNDSYINFRDMYLAITRVILLLDAT